MLDGHNALPQLIDNIITGLQQRGFAFKTVSEMIDLDEG
jgi:peptidoglycan/xylan/chitin deacetylase (PgdA/CDA1 family)